MPTGPVHIAWRSPVEHARLRDQGLRHAQRGGLEGDSVTGKVRVALPRGVLTVTSTRACAALGGRCLKRNAPVKCPYTSAVPVAVDRYSTTVRTTRRRDLPRPAMMTFCLTSCTVTVPRARRRVSMPTSNAWVAARYRHVTRVPRGCRDRGRIVSPRV